MYVYQKVDFKIPKENHIKLKEEKKILQLYLKFQHTSLYYFMLLK